MIPPLKPPRIPPVNIPNGIPITIPKGLVSPFRTINTICTSVEQKIPVTIPIEVTNDRNVIDRFKSFVRPAKTTAKQIPVGKPKIAPAIPPAIRWKEYASPDINPKNSPNKEDRIPRINANFQYRTTSYLVRRTTVPIVNNNPRIPQKMPLFMAKAISFRSGVEIPS
jgi:hypothetical protein